MYYNKVQYTLQQTTMYTEEYQCKYFNIIVNTIHPNGGHNPPQRGQYGRRDSMPPQVSMWTQTYYIFIHIDDVMLGFLF